MKPQQVGASHGALLYGTPVGKADSTCPFSGHNGRQKTMIKYAICTELLKLRSEVINHPCASDSGTNKSSGYAEIQWELKDGARSAGDLK